MNVDDVRAVVCRLPPDDGDTPVVEHHELDLGELLEGLQIAAVGAREGELEEDAAGTPLVLDDEAEALGELKLESNSNPRYSML